MNTNKLKDTIAKDLWVVLLDLLAVNLSYFLAFYFRFFDNTTSGMFNATKPQYTVAYPTV